MLKCFKRTMMIIYSASILLSVAVMTLWAVASGQIGAITPAYILASCGVLVLITMLLTTFVGQRYDNQANQLISLYNDQCDPASFVEQGRKFAETMDRPIDVEGSWYLALYGLALLDTGNAPLAAQYCDQLADAANQAKKPIDKAAILTNAEPLVFRLKPLEESLAFIEGALAVLDQVDTSKPDPARWKTYLTSERSIVRYMLEGDDDSLQQLFAQTRANRAFPRRLRVGYASAESYVHRRRNDQDAERECLEFVVANGNKLPVVPEAKTRLAQLSQ